MLVLMTFSLFIFDTFCDFCHCYKVHTYDKLVKIDKLTLHLISLYLGKVNVWLYFGDRLFSFRFGIGCFLERNLIMNVMFGLCFRVRQFCR